MKTKNIILPLFALLLVSCDPIVDPSDSQPDDFVIKTISPVGAPTLAFYDQGSNENFETNSTPSNVLVELQANNYNAVVFDSINALKSIKNNNLDFKLAKLITGGNFYLVSIDKEEGEMPTASDLVVSFGKDLIPDLVYAKLSEYWGIENEASYVASVNEALAVMKNGLHGGEKVDFVFIAQPALNIGLLDQNANTFGKVKIVKNIRAEWEKHTDQKAIPQAGLFVRNTDYEANETAFNNYVNEMGARIETAIDNPQIVKAALDAYGDIQAQSIRFGYNSNIMLTTQSDGKNGFGLVDPDDEIDVNEFLESLDLATFADSYFLNL